MQFQSILLILLSSFTIISFFFQLCDSFKTPRGIAIDICSASQKCPDRLPDSYSRVHKSLLYGAGVEAPPKPPEQKTRTGGGDDGDGLRVLSASEVQKYATTWSEYSQTLISDEDQLEERQQIHEKMLAFSKKMTGWAGRRRMAVGWLEKGSVKALVCCQLRRGGSLPYLVNTLVVELMGFDPLYAELATGSTFMNELRTMCIEQALYLDPSPLRNLGPNIAFYSLMGSMQVLEQDPEQENPLVHIYKERIKSPIIVVDNVPDWADLGHFWYEGATSNGVTFYFRRKLRGAVNEFEVTFEKPTAGNSTGSGTVGNPRIIKDEELLSSSLNIPGQSEIKTIQKKISQKLFHDFQKG